MATFTNWFNLIKPSGADGGDLVNVDNINDNMDVIDSALHQDDLDLAAALARIATLEARLSPKRAIVGATAVQSLVNNAETIINFANPAAQDNDGMWSAATPNRLTVKTDGLYLCNWTVSYAAAAGGNRIGLLKVNGVNAQAETPNIIGASLGFTFSKLLQLVVNDYVQISQYQSSGAALNTHNQPYPSLELVKLGD